MKMQFEILKQSIIDNILGPAEAGRFITIGYQRQRRSADNINEQRQVTVYFSESEIPKSAAQALGKVMHEVAFIIELAVVTPAKADLSILNSDTATADEKATALRQLAEAGVIADADMDKLIRIIFQTLMDARNDQMGMVPDEDHPNMKLVSNRWIDQIRKDTPSPDGEYVMLTGTLRLTCRIEETITGEDLKELENGATFEADIDLSGDDTEKTGVTVKTS